VKSASGSGFFIAGAARYSSQEWAQVHERVAEFAKYVS